LSRSNKATCNHCSKKFIADIYHLANLHKHLVEVDPNELTEEEKKKVI